MPPSAIVQRESAIIVKRKQCAISLPSGITVDSICAVCIHSILCSTVSTSFKTRGTALTKFSDIVKLVFHSNSGSIGSNTGSFPFNSAAFRMDADAQMTEISTYYRVFICETDQRKSGGDFWNQSSRKSTRKLYFHNIELLQVFINK